MLESQYVLTSNPITLEDMQVAYAEVMLLRVAKAKKHQLTQTQHIFEQREKTDRLLTWISRERSPMTTIAHLKDDQGASVMDPAGISTCFASYYSKFYSSREQYSQEELHNFLDQVTFPVLAPSVR